MERKTKIDFRTAYLRELEDCWNVIEEARSLMNANGSTQWTSEYPSKQDIMEDLNNGNAYVVTVDGKIAVYGAVVLNGEPQYEFLEGKWLTDGNYYVVHRLATLPEFQGRGLAKEFMRHVNSLCQVEEVPSIKIDTHANNRPMIHLLSTLAYSICGRVNYGKRGMRFAFEKLTMPVSNISQQ